jgi:hypothetical protein
LFLDRRIDPDAPVSGEFPFQPLRGLFEAVGEVHQFEITAMGSVVYVGPPEVAMRLRTIDQLRRAELQALGPRFRELTARDDLSWNDLSTPRTLIEGVCRQAKVSLANPELVPHDLWAAGALPGLARSTQLTILLAGFDLTFTCSHPGVLTLRPVRGDELWEQSYRLPPGKDGLVEEMRRQFPDAAFRIEASRLSVQGLLEDHEAIRRWLQAGRPVPAEDTATQVDGPLNQRFTLRVVRKPLGEVLRAIERETTLRITLNDGGIEESEAPLEQLVTFEVRDVDVDGLMKAVLAPLGWTYRRTGASIEVSAPRQP